MKRLTAALLVFLSLTLVGPSRAGAANAPTGKADDLVGAVSGLNLGIKGYFLGRTLNGEQAATARKNVVKDSYPGTFKFRDGDTFVVADNATNRILVIYEYHGAATADELKKMIGELVLDFEEPTLMAHQKTLYWAFDRGGRLSSGAFENLKAAGKGSSILATVKLNSSEEIEAVTSGKKVTAEVYFLISSEPLLRRYINNTITREE